MKAHTTAIITLKAVLVTADQTLRDELEPLSDHKLVVACSNLDGSGDLADPHVATFVAGKEIRKVIVVPGKIVNIVVAG